jgi:hypothetical protein
MPMTACSTMTRSTFRHGWTSISPHRSSQTWRTCWQWIWSGSRPLRAHWPRPAREPLSIMYDIFSQIKLLVVMLVLQFYYLCLKINKYLTFF